MLPSRWGERCDFFNSLQAGFSAIVQQTPPSQLRFEWKSLPADRQGPRNEKSDVWQFRFMS